jgi:hypothetical protein
LSHSAQTPDGTLKPKTFSWPKANMALKINEMAEWPDPGAQANDHEEQPPPLSYNDESGSDSDSNSDSEFSTRYDTSSPSE